MARSSLVCSIWQRYDFIPNIRCYQPEKSADPLNPKITHPNLPKGKEQVTLLCQDFSQSIQPMNISPLSFSPVGEMQVTLTIDSLLIIRQQEYLSLPYGGG